MNLDQMLGTAVSAIAGMPEEEFAVGLPEVEAEFQRRERDDVARAKHASFVDSLELDQAAYELGRHHDRQGDLGEAARWYRVAARHDYGDAALRLGEALYVLADRCARQVSTGPYTVHRDELHLITEATQAYAEAYAAGHPEAAEKMDEMLATFSRRQRLPRRVPPRFLPRIPAESVPPSPAHRDDSSSKAAGHDCSYVRAVAPAPGVLKEEEIREFSRHAAQCMPCLQEFIRLVRRAAASPDAIPDQGLGR